MKYILPLLLIVLFSTASLAQDVLLPVKTDKGIGFINQAGKMIIKPKYDETYGFISFGTYAQNNIAPVRVGDKWGFIDRKGMIMIKPSFEEVYTPREGLSPVKYSGKWGAINEKGKMVITPVYDRMSAFDGGYLRFCVTL